MREFILLMASLTALVALSIDAMLPALGVMGSDLGVVRHNDMQYVIGFLFIGLTVGQVFYGPLADAIGRKKALNIGLGLFLAGTAISWAATSLPVMLLGRLVQGIGVAGPRIVAMAIVRDRFHGRDMAYVMSMVMGVFIMVPAVAPSIGQLIMHVGGWREIFLMYAVATLLVWGWAHLRLKETLTPEHRRSLRLGVIWDGFKEAAATRVTLGYTLAGGISFGALLGYLNSSQQIFQDIFHAGDMFAIYFGLLAIAIGAAFFSNSALVRKLGMRFITRHSLHVLILISVLFLPYVLLVEAPSLLVFMLFMATAFFCLGLMFGNMASMALEPMGHMAGLASAFNGAVSNAISMVLGGIIGQWFDGTLVPMAAGFALLSLLTWLMMRWSEKGHVT